MKKLLLTTLISIFSLQSMVFAEVTRSNFNSILSANGDMSSASTKEEIYAHISKLNELSAFVNSYDDECERSDQKDLEYISTKLNTDLEELDKDLELIKGQYDAYESKLGRKEDSYKSNKSITLAATALTAVGAGVIATTGESNKAMRGMKSVDLAKCKDSKSKGKLGRYYLQHKAACDLLINNENKDALKEKHSGQDLESAKLALENSISLAKKILDEMPEESKSALSIEVGSLKSKKESSEKVIEAENSNQEDYKNAKDDLNAAIMALSNKISESEKSDNENLMSAKERLNKAIIESEAGLKSLDKRKHKDDIKKYNKVIKEANGIYSDKESTKEEIEKSIKSLSEIQTYNKTTASKDEEDEDLMEIEKELSKEEDDLAKSIEKITKGFVGKKDNSDFEYDDSDDLDEIEKELKKEEDDLAKSIKKTSNKVKKKSGKVISKNEVSKDIKSASKKTKKSVEGYNKKIKSDLKDINNENDYSTVSIKIKGSEDDLSKMADLISKFAVDMDLEVKKVSDKLAQSELQGVLEDEVAELNSIKSSSKDIIDGAKMHLEKVKSEKNDVEETPKSFEEMVKAGDDKMKKFKEESEKKMREQEVNGRKAMARLALDGIDSFIEIYKDAKDVSKLKISCNNYSLNKNQKDIHYSCLIKIRPSIEKAIEDLENDILVNVPKDNCCSVAING